MNAQIKEVPSIVTEIAEYSQTAAALSDLRHRYSGVAFNVTTTKGMDEAKKARQEVKGYRTALEAKRKEIKAPALDRCRLIDDEAKTITAALLELEEPIDQQIKAEESRKEAERAAKAEAERMRVARHHATIQYLRGIPADVASASIEKIASEISQLEALDITDSLEEFQPQCQQAKEESLAKLREMHDAALAHEAEQARIKAEQEAEAARIAAERAELARLRAEQEARDRDAAAALEVERAKQEAELKAQREAAAKEAKRIADEREAAEREQAAKLAAERATQEAELRKQREAQEAELRAQREAQAKADAEAAAALRAEESRLAAERAELRRQQEESAAAQRASEEAKHAADMRIRGLAHEMLSALKDAHSHIADNELRTRIGNLIATAEGA